MKGYSKFIIGKERMGKSLGRMEERPLKKILLEHKDIFKNTTEIRSHDFGKSKANYKGFKEYSRSLFLLGFLEEEELLERKEEIISSFKKDTDKQFKKRWGIESFKIHLGTSKKIKRLEQGK